VRNPAAGDTPFGFVFDNAGHLVVSDAFGGADGQAALTSYRVAAGGRLQSVTGPVPDHHTAACWVAATGDGRFAYTTNTHDGTISGYRVLHDGSLSLLDADGLTAATGGTPIDAAMSGNRSSTSKRTVPTESSAFEWRSTAA
jgi:6-phosphogluconolactonase (cycloisomerase 2 family)